MMCFTPFRINPRNIAKIADTIWRQKSRDSVYHLLFVQFTTGEVLQAGVDGVSDHFAEIIR